MLQEAELRQRSKEASQATASNAALKVRLAPAVPHARQGVLYLLKAESSAHAHAEPQQNYQCRDDPTLAALTAGSSPLQVALEEARQALTASQDGRRSAARAVA